MLNFPFGFRVYYESLNSTCRCQANLQDNGLWIPQVLESENTVIIMQWSTKTSTPHPWCFLGWKDWQIMWHAGKVVKARWGEYNKTQVQWMKHLRFQKVRKDVGHEGIPEVEWSVEKCREWMSGDYGEYCWLDSVWLDGRMVGLSNAWHDWSFCGSRFMNAASHTANAG